MQRTILPSLKFHTEAETKDICIFLSFRKINQRIWDSVFFEKKEN